MPHTPLNQTPPACAACGGVMHFSPAEGRLRCVACGGGLAREAVTDEALSTALAEHDYERYLALRAGDEPSIEPQVVSCPQCGAQTHFEPHVVAAPCAFCRSPLVASAAQALRQIQPKAMAPFKVDDAAAKALFKQWLHGLWFAPNALKRMVSAPDSGRGVYVPCWTFDASSVSHYSGARGVHRTVTDTRTDSQGRQVSESRTVTDWFPTQGTVSLQFDDELVLASHRVPPSLADAVQDTPLSALQVPSADMAAGFTVEAYQLGLAPAFEQARERFEARIESAVRRDIGGDEQRVHSVNSQFSEIRFRHVLMPVWIYSYTWQQKVWQVVINGQTGRVEGDRPWSAVKITALALTVAALAAGLWWWSQNQ